MLHSAGSMTPNALVGSEYMTDTHSGRAAVPPMRVAALHPADFAILTFLNADATARDALRIGATKRWGSPEERRAWAGRTVGELLGLRSRRLALALEGSLMSNSDWSAYVGCGPDALPAAERDALRQATVVELTHAGERHAMTRPWLRVTSRIVWPDAGARRTFSAFGGHVELTPSQVRHMPKMLDHARQRLGEHVPVAWWPIVSEAFDSYAREMRAGPRGHRSARGRRSYFTDEWWRDARWAYQLCRKQLCFSDGGADGNELEVETGFERSYVNRRATKWLKDAGLATSSSIDSALTS